MNRINTKSVVLGAMIAALFGMLSLFNTYTGGMIDILICYFMVIPVAWYGHQYNIKMNTLVVFASMIVVFMFGTPFFVISSFSALVIGLFLGEMIKRGSKKEIILLGTFFICFLNNILIYQVFSGLLGMDIVNEITVMIHDIQTIYPAIQNISIDMIMNIVPMILLIMSILEMYVIILICQLVFMRLKIEFPSNFHIATLHFSKRTGFILVVVMFVSYVCIRFLNMNFIILKYINLLSQLAFILQGFSFMNLYAVMKRSRWIVLVSFVMLFIPICHIMFTILGMLDIFSDLRRNLLYNSNN